ncbi:MAG: APC family permease, partial [Actinomycetota bacterium]|nr:APC family permease [Actinomycetota bacterium]
IVGASRLLFALARDASGDKGLGRTSAAGTPANAAVVVAALMAVIIVVTIFFGAEPFDTFLWSATIGTLLLLVIYVLTTIGAIR